MEGKRTKFIQGEGSPSICLELSLLLDFMFLASETVGLILWELNVLTFYESKLVQSRLSARVSMDPLLLVLVSGNGDVNRKPFDVI